MSMLDLVRKLESLGVKLFVESGKLKSKGKQGVLKNDLKDSIKSNKVSLIRLIKIKSKVSKIWCELLGVDTVDDLDSFFDLGGHSLLATKMVFKLQKQFGLDLNVNVIFKYRALINLSIHIDTLLKLKEIKKDGADKLTEGNVVIF